MPLHVATPWLELPVSMTLSQKFLRLEASPLEVQSLQQKEKKRRKRKGKKKKENSKSLKTQISSNVMLVERKASCHVAHFNLE